MTKPLFYGRTTMHAKAFARELGLGLTAFHAVGDIDQLRGLAPGTILIVLEGAEEREGYVPMLREARVRGFRVYHLVDASVSITR